MNIKPFLATFLLISVCFSGFCEQAPSIQVFFAVRAFRSAKISPDGHYIAGITESDNEVSSLVLYNIDTGKTEAIKGDSTYSIYSFSWHGSDRILFNLEKDGLYNYGLYSVRLDKIAKHTPIRLSDTVYIVGHPKLRPDRIVAWTPSTYMFSPGSYRPFIEIDVNKRITGGAWDRLDDSTARFLDYPDDNTYPVSWIDGGIDGEPTLAWSVRNKRPSYFYWDLVTEKWQDPVLDPEKYRVVAMDPDRAHLWVVYRHPELGSSLCKVNIKTKEVSQPILSDKRYDLSSSVLLFSQTEQALVGVRYEKTRVFTHWISPKFSAVQQAIEKKLGNADAHMITNWDDADNRFVIYSSSPQQPGFFYIFDAKSDNLVRIASAQPKLESTSLRPSFPINFKARDGLELFGYITLPAGATKEKPAPLVVLVHGGPRARDTWEFDPEVQFLASRGYAVLQPNYRGSAGYYWSQDETDYETAFAAMRDDVIDATKIALKNPVLDPKRVAIMGGSFGGYISVAAPIESPDLYNCAISFCGVFDWAEHAKSKRGERGWVSGPYELMTGRFGDPKENKKAYDDISPINQVDRLKTPVLLVHGKLDEVVSAKQTRMLAAALKKRNLPHETLYRPLAGHGFFYNEDRWLYIQTVEKFLTKYMPAPAASP